MPLLFWLLFLLGNSWWAILDRLSLKDRLLRMSIVVDPHYVLCAIRLESRSHLFFGCSFSCSIWENIFGLCGFVMPISGWDQELRWVCSRLKGISFQVFILKIARCNLIYFVLEERNYRVLRGRSRSVDDAMEAIREVVCVRARSRCNSSHVNSRLCAAYGIS
ncbi:uncharacterized protein LOC120201931 [Hibiscus syriacus]|uniref:uncharacterized protein LOC120201931 n=1 Tax=Hibiscus syriacus TaxID=106335 RepID=UPI0019226EFC|nr:uncharacterized protein LOC120201931 [Hibiscus syriacus]